MKESPEIAALRQSTYRAGLLQSQAYRALNAFLTNRLSGFGLSAPEWSGLGLLYEAKGSLRPSQIAQQLGIKQPVCTGLLKKLEHKHLIVRRLDHNDSRVSNVRISAGGKALAAKIERSLRAEMRVFLSDIDRAQLATYLMVLEQIAAKI